MASLTGTPIASSQDLYVSSTQNPGAFSMGHRAYGENGKQFNRVLVGASALVKGNLLQASAQDTSYENMAIGTAGAVGDMFLQVTNGTATITSAQFQGGSISTYTAGTIAIGDEYTIVDVTGTLTTGGALQVWLDKPLRAAVTTSAKVNMKRSPYSGVIQFPVTTQTEAPVGVAIYEAAAATYAWIQSFGPGVALSDNSTFAVGSMLSPSLATAGAVGVNVAGTTHGTVGWARQAAASAHGIAVMLTM